ncbi:MAG TPA: lytic transglycosylase domain-containing protein [Baekduia sp.]|nr:lytic transglycosylase domain-containing protein [Baekduia sp.]
MSVELIGARVAEIQQQIAAFTGQGTAAPSTSFASQLASAQSGAGATVPAAATPTTLGGGANATTATVPTTLGGGAPTQYDAQITAAATKYGIDPALLKGLIRQESNFNAGAHSGAGAQGLTQLMPGTASSLGVDPSDPAQAIEGGAKYLKQQLDRFGGDPTKALAAYNAGPGAVAKYGGVPPYAETQNYVQKVLGFAAEYEGTAPVAAATTSAVPVTTTPVSAASLLASTDADTSSSGSLDYSTV